MRTIIVSKMHNNIIISKIGKNGCKHINVDLSYRMPHAEFEVLNIPSTQEGKSGSFHNLVKG